MKRSANKNFFHRFFTSRVFFVIIGGLLLLFVLGFARSYYQAYKIQKEIDSLHEQVQTLNQKRLESLDMLSYVLSQNFVEEKAREELNLKKDGEHVIVVPTEDEPLESPKRAPVSSTGQPVANPLKWWYYFTHQLIK